ncbi:16S rRNA (cytidine(1402)-2'-O)-methyltransferase [Legionella sp. W05-934-2]|jgi:16S rRNA (cytidine1402-2'-O)-methyltransferase|uniref:16S rRNA (cytidine(1402)-2'-O)-methyltransferase n=1 Tax=Legionella sp. W05-934-2 TaxID=1198649 RepID=UPI0034630F2A
MKNLSSIGYGTIFVIATPIGHLDDISKRAIDTLKSVDFIVAEDTRHSKTLLQAYQINKPMYAMHAHNEQQKAQSILNRVKEGASIALISDAGTPLISDPGYPLIQLAHQQHIPVSPIPGSCALIAALSCAGIPCQQFTFLGFLPHKSEQKMTLLRQFTQQGLTLVCYESPHRLLDTLSCIDQLFDQHYHFVLAKELTKAFETIRYGTAEQHRQWLVSDLNHQKGEFVLLFPPMIIEEKDNSETILALLLSELPVKQAAHLCAKITGKPKNKLYQLALSLQNSKN